MVDISKQVTDLNAGWYNVVTKAMGIDQTNFQLAQGTLGLQSADSSGLFLMADAVPPPTAVAYFDPAGLSRRSSAYDMLLHALTVEGGADLPTALGDLYSKWIAYRNADTSDKTQLQLFQAWANRNLDPGKTAAAINVFKAQLTAPLNQAYDAFAAPANQQQFVNSAGNSYSLYTYSGTIDGATKAIQQSSGVTIDFDSNTMSTTLNSLTVQGAASGMYDIFSGKVSGGFDQLNTTAASSRITITGTIDGYGTLMTQPMGWFNSSEFGRAFGAKNDATVWDPASSAGNWNGFFGQPNGSLSRRITQLFLVSGYDITVRSYASYSQSDVTKINAEASFGIWPFFSASASTSKENAATLNDDGSLSVRHTLDKGLIQIWGATVEPAPA